MSAKDLDRASNKLTRGLILCSPCNPTGAVYTLAELGRSPSGPRSNDVWIISDEIYRRINYGPGPAPSLLDLPDELLERTVIIYGASKAYAMTGWRIGAALAPPHLAKAMAALQSHTTTGANQPAHVGGRDGVHRRAGGRGGHQDGGRVPPPARLPGGAVPRARRPGVEFVEPHGAFYFFFRVDGIREKDPVTGSALLRAADEAGGRRAGARRRLRATIAGCG